MYDPDALASLIDEADKILDRVSVWQLHGSGGPSPRERRDVQAAYSGWFSRALQHVPSEARDKFRDYRTGGAFVKRIDTFLSEPMKLNAMWSEDAGPLVDRYQNPYATMFKESLEGQLSILQDANVPDVAVTAVLDDLERILRGIPDFIASLTRSGRSGVPAPVIADETDLQVLLEAILRLHYQDVRREDFTPSSAGANSRVDFLLAESGVVIEAKMTRPSLKDKKIGEELLIDWGRYRKHPDAKAIIAIVYDPGRLVINPAGLARDLESKAGFQTRAIVVR